MRASPVRILLVGWVLMIALLLYGLKVMLNRDDIQHSRLHAEYGGTKPDHSHTSIPNANPKINDATLRSRPGHSKREVPVKKFTTLARTKDIPSLSPPRRDAPNRVVRTRETMKIDVYNDENDVKDPESKLITIKPELKLRTTPQPPTCPPLKNVDVQGQGGSTNHPDCDVPCTWHGGVSLITTARSGPVKILLSMEGPVIYPNLLRYGDNNALGTTSFKSEVPVPYFSWAEYDIQTPPVEFDKVIPGASFIAKNCNSQNSREALASNLMKHIRVDALSSCLHNAQPPNGLSMQHKVPIMRSYLFHFAFENQCYEDYMTEKLWGSLESGSLPVYHGAPNVWEHVPEKAVVFVNDFKDHNALGQYLLYLTKNKTAYEEHHAWRKKPLPKWFKKKYSYTHWPSSCRVCRYTYSKMNNLPWNKTSQRSICPVPETPIVAMVIRYGESSSKEQLADWLKYILYIGVDDIIIYDVTKNPTDRVRINHAMVDVLSWPPLEGERENRETRARAYEHFMQHALPQDYPSAAWVLCIHVGEFPVLKQVASVPRNFLKEMAQKHSSDGINRLMVAPKSSTASVMLRASSIIGVYPESTRDHLFETEKSKEVDLPAISMEKSWSNVAAPGIQKTELRFLKVHQVNL
eukprot:m.25124 g.25124  ORF g.25124 m.25124 type:complete len:635 (+) comp7679_c0_seq2:143-2047(+)